MSTRRRATLIAITTSALLWVTGPVTAVPAEAHTSTSVLTSVQQVPARRCAIKGNVTNSGKKIYHVPGQRYYKATKISHKRGERWFCTERDARKAGWRKSKI